SLESIKFPSSVNEVGDAAFCYCVSLRDVVLNEGLQKIGEQAFHVCELLANIKFPPTVREVGDDAFGGCSNLRGVLLNEGIQTIGEWAFNACESLDNIKFPSISRRLQTLSQNGQTAIENKIGEIPGVEWR
ncbi:hypothetical protein ACHAXR_000007, partial [Thalassiosira sp. AJA248-18]